MIHANGATRVVLLVALLMTSSIVGAGLYARPNTVGRFTRVNTLFTLDERHTPGPSFLKWEGSAELRPGGPPLEIPIP